MESYKEDVFSDSEHPKAELERLQVKIIIRAHVRQRSNAENLKYLSDFLETWCSHHNWRIFYKSSCRGVLRGTTAVIDRFISRQGLFVLII